MGEQQILFFWILGSGGFSALLGGLFGALVGALTWRSGRAAGTRVGFRVASAYERAVRCELTAGQKGALIGGTDGSLFLGAVGVLAGAAIASQTPAAGDVLGPTAIAVFLLVLGGTFFGLLALVLIRAGTRAVATLFAGSVMGAGLGLMVARGPGLFPGLIAGLAVGSVLALFVKR